MFRLPSSLDLTTAFHRRCGEVERLPAVVDTLLLEPDLNRFVLIWRARLPLGRNIFEVLQASVFWTGTATRPVSGVGRRARIGV
jgi:hypothetical protein